MTISYAGKASPSSRRGQLVAGTTRSGVEPPPGGTVFLRLFVLAGAVAAALSGGCAVGSQASSAEAPSQRASSARESGDDASPAPDAPTDEDPPVDEACARDSDSDGVADCDDECPSDPQSGQEGRCGCNVTLEHRREDCACEDGFEELAGTCQRRPPSCGNGQVDTGEACDDGNESKSDECVSCTVAVCGDGWVRAGLESCDGDGAGRPGDTPSCDADCTARACGDGRVNYAAGETCDLGEIPSAATAACDTDCTAPSCGDGLVNPFAGEICDDANGATGDGCGSCRPEGGQLGVEATGPRADDGTANGKELVTKACPAGAVAIAVVGSSTDWVNQLGVRCVALDAGFSPIGSGKGAGRIGSVSGSKPVGLGCPQGRLLVGITVEYNGRFRAVTGHCLEVARIAARHSQSAADTGSTARHDTAAGGARSVSSLMCPAGSAVAGMAGHTAADKSISELAVLCRQLQL